MISTELKRYSKSIINIIIIFFLIIIIFISFSSTKSSYSEWAAQINSGASDINNEIIYEVLNGYNGITYLTRFFFGVDESFQLVLIFVIGFSIMFGSSTFEPIHSGFGNFIMTKTSYKKHFLVKLLSQAIYMCLFILLLVTLFSTVTLLIMPQNWSTLPSDTYGFVFKSNMDFVKTLFAQTLLIIGFVVPIVSITCATPVFITNKYLNMAIPIISIIVIFIAANTVSNFSPLLAELTRLLDVTNYMFIIYNYNQFVIQGLITSSITKNTILEVALLPGLIIIINTILSLINIKRFGRDYLK